MTLRSNPPVPTPTSKGDAISRFGRTRLAFVATAHARPYAMFEVPTAEPQTLWLPRPADMQCGRI